MCVSNIPQESPGHSQQLPCPGTNSNSNSFNFIKLYSGKWNQTVTKGGYSSYPGIANGNFTFAKVIPDHQAHLNYCCLEFDTQNFDEKFHQFVFHKNQHQWQ